MISKSSLMAALVLLFCCDVNAQNAESEYLRWLFEQPRHRWAESLRANDQLLTDSFYEECCRRRDWALEQGYGAELDRWFFLVNELKKVKFSPYAGYSLSLEERFILELNRAKALRASDEQAEALVILSELNKYRDSELIAPGLREEAQVLYKNIFKSERPKE